MVEKKEGELKTVNCTTRDTDERRARAHARRSTYDSREIPYTYISFAFANRSTSSAFVLSKFEHRINNTIKARRLNFFKKVEAAFSSRLLQVELFQR